MNIQTAITGIGTTSRDRASAIIRGALAKREAELAAVSARRPSVRAVPATSLTTQGGK